MKKKLKFDDEIKYKSVIKCERCLHALNNANCIGKYKNCKDFSDISSLSSSSNEV